MSDAWRISTEILYKVWERKENKTKQNSRLLKKQNLKFSNSLDVYNLDYE